MSESELSFFDHLTVQYRHFLRRIPVINRIPGFNTIPPNIETSGLQFYKLANLVLTLGMFVHLMWVVVFYYFRLPTMSYINVVSVTIYILAIIINRRGYFLISSGIMVFEIILHQLVAVHFLGLDGRFQSYVLVISIFPFLMPKGNWHLKGFFLVLLVLTFLYLELVGKNHAPVFNLTNEAEAFFRVSNTLFCFISLAVSGAYFNLAIHDTQKNLEDEKHKSDNLLLNILPPQIAEELKEWGTVLPKYYPEVTVMFTDFKNFTPVVASLSPEQLVAEIDYYFSEFDKITARHSVEKIKTIGDAYMCVAGLPVPNPGHAHQAIKAALEIIEFIRNENQTRKINNQPYFDIRIGIHTGPVVAGIVGLHKFAYDVWGDTVNTASRLENNCEGNRINVSESTFKLTKDAFNFEFRGRIEAKGKGEVAMYFVDQNHHLGLFTK